MLLEVGKADLKVEIAYTFIEVIKWSKVIGKRIKVSSSDFSPGIKKWNIAVFFLLQKKENWWDRGRWISRKIKGKAEFLVLFLIDIKKYV